MIAPKIFLTVVTRVWWQPFSWLHQRSSQLWSPVCDGNRSVDCTKDLSNCGHPSDGNCSVDCTKDLSNCGHPCVMATVQLIATKIFSTVVTRVWWQPFSWLQQRSFQLWSPVCDGNRSVDCTKGLSNCGHPSDGNRSVDCNKDLSNRGHPCVMATVQLIATKIFPTVVTRVWWQPFSWLHQRSFQLWPPIWWQPFSWLHQRSFQPWSPVWWQPFSWLHQRSFQLWSPVCDGNRSVDCTKDLSNCGHPCVMATVQLIAPKIFPTVVTRVWWQPFSWLHQRSFQPWSPVWWQPFSWLHQRSFQLWSPVCDGNRSVDCTKDLSNCGHPCDGNRSVDCTKDLSNCGHRCRMATVQLIAPKIFPTVVTRVWSQPFSWLHQRSFQLWLPVCDGNCSVDCTKDCVWQNL